MKKFTTLILAFICISAFYALNLSTNCFAAAPNSYETLVDNNEVKKVHILVFLIIKNMLILHVSLKKGVKKALHAIKSAI